MSRDAEEEFKTMAKTHKQIINDLNKENDSLRTQLEHWKKQAYNLLNKEQQSNQQTTKQTEEQNQNKQENPNDIQTTRKKIKKNKMVADPNGKENILNKEQTTKQTEEQNQNKQEDPNDIQIIRKKVKKNKIVADPNGKEIQLKMKEKELVIDNLEGKVSSLEDEAGMLKEKLQQREVISEKQLIRISKLEEELQEANAKTKKFEMLENEQSQSLAQIEQLTRELLIAKKSLPVLPTVFDLPGEYTVTYFSAYYNNTSGYLYLTPRYLCFINETVAGKAISFGKTLTFKIEINKIKALNKKGSSRLYRWNTSSLDIVDQDDKTISLTGLYFRKQLVDEILSLAKTLGNNKIVVLRDDKKENDL